MAALGAITALRGAQIGGATAGAGQGITGISSLLEFGKATESVGKEAEKVTPDLTGMQKALGGLSDALKAVRQVDQQLNAPLKAFQGFISQIQSQVVSFVAKANPAAAQRWSLAVDDFMAVMGRAFVPLLEEAGKIVRTVADAFASLSPEGQGFTRAMSGVSAVLSTVGEVVKRIAPAFVRVGEVLGPVFTAVEKAFKSLAGAAGEGLALFITGLARAIQVVTPLIELFAKAVEVLADALGMVLSEANKAAGSADGFKPGASRGAAVRQASITDLNSSINRQYTSAFSIGSDPQTKTAKNTEQTAKNTGDMITLLKNLNPGRSAEVGGFQLNPARAAADVATWPIREGLRQIERR